MKLGVRGLIDAYGESAEKALSLAGRVEKIITSSVKISLEYNSVGLITRMLDNVGAINPAWEYGEAVNVNANIPVNELERFSRELNELTARKIIRLWEKIS